MAFIAIIHINDDHTAARIAERYAHGDAGRIVGLYNFPSRAELRKGCLGCGKGKLVGWGRHGTGYMVCATCGGRNPKVRRWFTGALFDWFGANILGNDAPALFRTPDGYSPPQ